MRTIKFRGKRVDNGEWVYGYYVSDPLNRHRIYLQPFSEATNNTYYFVHPETVGQLFGYGVYDGDIIDVGDGKERVAEYDEIECAVTLTPNYEARSFGELGVRGRLHIIGNIHDNPELINQ